MKIKFQILFRIKISFLNYKNKIWETKKYK